MFGEQGILGCISPSTIQIPSELDELLPPGMGVVATVLDVRAHTDEQFRAARQKLAGAVDAVVGEGAQAVWIDGVPVAVWDGYQAEQDMLGELSSHCGVPVTTGVSSAVEGLRHLGVQRLIAATAYIPEVNERVGRYFGQAGFELLAIEGLAVRSPAENARLSGDAYADLARKLFAAHPQADGFFLGGRGNLMPTAAAVERELGKPVVMGRQASLWWVLRAIGRDFGRGRLLASL